MHVAILGCGYVGLELGRQLTARDHEVVGVRRSDAGIDAIEDAGFDAVRADVTDPESLASVPDVDAVVFAASSGGRDAEAAREIYLEGLRTAIETFGDRENAPNRLVYTSSTGVYGDHDGNPVDEETPLEPTTEKTEVLVDAERLALELSAEYGVDGTVARFAGLYGPGRYRLERYLDGPVTEGYLNMVHRDDAAGAVRHLLEEDLATGEVVLVVDDEPIEKWAFADWLADECDRSRPEKQTTADRLENDELSASARQRILANKRCSNEKLREAGYEFAYPTFREGYRDVIDDYCNE
ncbi:SDR family oxidoreductase [Natronobacterium gregoryi]|uniref:NAD(P)-dependent oxidoreductase n=2 Tax=Natronobacterium gregoryi TaxID=44930 RepID=L0ADC4_NATGS|nr:SDR family oxidoreductase [Natronobacterium gregoryi]AFZ71913.1 nucleoside-diphosphate-sugar epimerase [Natronobacterium gregoryi SP2]ELY62466.1 NAD-dependent epimerase/dehydratase [Natronobacterium gregoryi SP2]PLK20742.1 NAD(P)-dependent oxidoreductase [Natronobacterium gregoryi SP2]SFJ14122.1 Nucleoside-diphosphate-sugar epimerase [Natronobacterium gregoryi]